MNRRDSRFNSNRTSRGIDEGQEQSVKGRSLRIGNHPDLGRRWDNVLDCLNPFPRYRKFESAKPTDFATGQREAGDEVLANRIGDVGKYDWDRAGLIFESYHSWCCTGQEYIRAQTHQLRRISLQSVRGWARPAIIQPNIQTLGPPELLK